VEAPYKELEGVIAQLKALRHDDIAYAMEDDCIRLNAEAVQAGEEEIYGVTEDSVDFEFNNKFYWLRAEAERLYKKLHRTCAKCDDLNYMVEVIIAEAEFVLAKTALTIAAKKFDELDEDRYLAYYA
jgi:hypothetical protein